MTTTTLIKTKLSPVEIEARIAAAKAAEAGKKTLACQLKLATSAGIEGLGLTVAHFRVGAATPFGLSQSHLGGVTVAYRHKSTNTFVELATAICRDDEVFSRKLGTQVAVEQFTLGHVIRVPLYGRAAAAVVAELFDAITTIEPEVQVFVVRH
jgi:hypothetical protein